MNTPVTSPATTPAVPPPPVNPYPKTLIGITGPSGTGKSTSLRNLDPKITRILDVERKGLPFKTPPGFVVPVDTFDKLKVEIDKAKRDPAIQILVVDSITAAVEAIQVDCERNFKGFDIWKHYNDRIGELLISLKNSGKCCIITSLEEIVQIQGLDGGLTTRRRMFVQGKEWANKGIESECLAVWTSFAKRNKETQKMDYMFATQTDGVTLAKTPPFWGLAESMPNDVAAAIALAGKALSS